MAATASLLGKNGERRLDGDKETNQSLRELASNPVCRLNDQRLGLKTGNVYQSEAKAGMQRSILKDGRGFKLGWAQKIQATLVDGT